MTGRVDPLPGAPVRVVSRHGLAGRWAGAAIVAVFLAAALPGTAAGQRFAIELKAGASVGSYTATNAGLDFLPAAAFGATVEARLTESTAGYVGLTRSSFGCEEGFCAGRDVTLTSQGLILGGRWSPGLPWVRVGLALQQLQLTADAQEETTDVGVGWDLGAGVELPLSRRLLLRPGLTYIRHAASTDQGDGHAAVLALELGVALALGD